MSSTQNRRIDRVHEDETFYGHEPNDNPRAPTRKPSPDTLRKWFDRVDDRFMGTPMESIHPHEAILWAMRVSAGEVAYCDAQIARLEEDELFERPLKQTTIALPSGNIETVTEVRDVETMNRWVMWRDHSMKNMATYAKMALDVGIEERQIQLAEQQAQQLVAIISAVLTDLGHDLQDFRIRDVVRKRLMEGSIEGNAQEVPVS
jgi:hypothetical protein